MKIGNRHYNNVIKELWWWVQENASWFLIIGFGVLAGLLIGWAYMSLLNSI